MKYTQNDVVMNNGSVSNDYQQAGTTFIFEVDVLYDDDDAILVGCNNRAWLIDCGTVVIQHGSMKPTVIPPDTSRPIWPRIVTRTGRERQDVSERRRRWEKREDNNDEDGSVCARQSECEDRGKNPHQQLPSAGYRLQPTYEIKIDDLFLLTNALTIKVLFQYTLAGVATTTTDSWLDHWFGAHLWTLKKSRWPTYQIDFLI